MARFAQFFELLPNGCSDWKGHVGKRGYAQFSFRGRPVKAHKWHWEQKNGPVPEGYEVDHLCHTNDLSCPGGDTCPHRRCTVLAHLEPVTTKVNVHRSRGPAAINARKTHCVNGHEFTPENTLRRRDGRACRACQNAAQARMNQKLRGGRPPLPRGHNNSSKTHCAKGHPYDEANTLWTKKGSRQCRECRREEGGRAYAEKKAERNAT